MWLRVEGRRWRNNYWWGGWTGELDIRVPGGHCGRRGGETGARVIAAPSYDCDPRDKTRKKLKKKSQLFWRTSDPVRSNNLIDILASFILKLWTWQLTKHTVCLPRKNLVWPLHRQYIFILYLWFCVVRPQNRLNTTFISCRSCLS